MAGPHDEPGRPEERARSDDDPTLRVTHAIGDLVDEAFEFAFPQVVSVAEDPGAWLFGCAVVVFWSVLTVLAMLVTVALWEVAPELESVILAVSIPIWLALFIGGPLATVYWKQRRNRH